MNTVEDDSVQKNVRYNLDKIFDVVLAFSGEVKYNGLLDTILSKMMEITSSDSGTLYIVKNKKLHYHIIKNVSLNIYQFSKNIDLAPMVLDEHNDNIACCCALKNKIIKVDDIYADNKFDFTGLKDFDRVVGYSTRSVLVFPLTTIRNDTEEVLGVVQLLNATDCEGSEICGYGDINNPPVVPMLAKMASSTLSNLVHYKEVYSLFYSFVSVITQTIDERSPYNINHTKNVTRYCGNFAEYLNEKYKPQHPYYFDKNRLEQLVLAAMLHDIGKIVTPLEILNKADRLGDRVSSLYYRFDIKALQIENDFLKAKISQKDYDLQVSILDNAKNLVKRINKADFLTDTDIANVQKLADINYIDQNKDVKPLFTIDDIECLSIKRGTLAPSERVIMQEHASITEKILNKTTLCKYCKNIPNWTKNHHEFLDGTGYPDGLQGEEISLETCIITICDIFEGLTALDRPYKKNCVVSTEKAIKKLSDMAEKGKLHKDLVALFVQGRCWERSSKAYSLDIEASSNYEED